MKMEPVKSFEAEQLFVDLDKPSLRGLSHMLRRPELWPEGFVWDYRSCLHCAMGMAHSLWKVLDDRYDAPTCMTTAFGISMSQSVHIFANAHIERRVGLQGVTPENVADDIDAYLARQRPPSPIDLAQLTNYDFSRKISHLRNHNLRV